MRRYPTHEDVERWQAFAAKVREAEQALRDADVLLGKLIPTLDGDDSTGLEMVRLVGDKLEQARMAVGSVEHPVVGHWAGGPPDNPATSYSWRY